MTEENIDQQRTKTQAEFKSLSEREKQVQASFWAQNFLIAELAAANRLLRNLLVEKGIFNLEDDNDLATTISSKETLRIMYDNTEKAFYDKYQRVRYAMENPQEIAELMGAAEEGENDGSL